MIATCTSCASKFRVDDAKIGPRGAKVKCSRCGVTFIVRPQAYEAPPETEFAVGDAPFQAPLPPEPTPISLRTPLQEFPIEFTPANEPAPLAPPLPGPPPLRREQERFDLTEPAPALELEPELVPPPMMDTENAPPPIRRPTAADAPLELMAPEPAPFGTSTDTMLDLSSPSAPLTLDLNDLNTTRPINIAALRASVPSAQDLFDTSFSPPLSPAPMADEPTRPMIAPDLDPLAGLPTFDQQVGEEDPQFEGGLSQEGIVTKSIDVTALREHLRAQPVASIELARPAVQERVTQPAITAPPRDDARGSNRVVAMMTTAALALVAIALALAYRGGGVQGLSATTVPSPLSVERLSIIPYATHEGGRVWILRGQVRNRSSDTHRFHLAVDGANQPVTAPAGVELDPAALFERGEIRGVGQPIAQLPAKESAEFTIALGAGDVSQPDALTARAVAE